MACFSPFAHATFALSVAQEYLALGGGPPGFRPGFTCPTLLGWPSTEGPSLSPTGLSPAVVVLSNTLRLGRAFVTPPPRPAPRRRRLPQPRSRKAQGLARDRFGLFPFRSPLLGESRFLSSPAGTKMCQFPALAPAPYLFRRRYPGITLGGLPHSEIPGSQQTAAPRGLSQLATSFIASGRLGIHRAPFVA